MGPEVVILVEAQTSYAGKTTKWSVTRETTAEVALRRYTTPSGVHQRGTEEKVDEEVYRTLTAGRERTPGWGSVGYRRIHRVTLAKRATQGTAPTGEGAWLGRAPTGPSPQCADGSEGVRPASSAQIRRSGRNTLCRRGVLLGC